MARRGDASLAALLEKFVCVRVVQGWGLDLSLFQFDGDLTLAVFFLNADRTIYGRYGTKQARDSSLEGLVAAATAALELHGRHPADKAALAAKTGPAPLWKTPEVMPTLRKRHTRGDVSSYGCIHCHTVNEGETTSRWIGGQGVPDRLLWKYPLPNALGLGIDAKDGRSVRTVSSGSAAQEAGFKSGDRVARIEGQPIVSVADVQWVLHQAPDSGALRFDVERDGQVREISLRAAEGWRRRIPFHRNNTTSMLQKAVAGFFCEALGGGERQKRGLADDGLALRVAYLPGAKEPDPNLNAVRAGLRVGDVITEVDGLKARMTLDEWIAYVLQKKKPGETLQLTVLRAGAAMKLDIPLPR